MSPTILASTAGSKLQVREIVWQAKAVISFARSSHVWCVQAMIATWLLQPKICADEVATILNLFKEDLASG